MSSSYLLYTSCFHQREYVDIVVNMLNSYFDVIPENTNIDFLVYTNTEFRALIEARMAGKPVKFFEKNFVKTMNQTRISKVDVFDFPNIAQYEKIVYVDADTMFLSDPAPLFHAIVEDVVYAGGEGNILSEANYWGRSLFLKNDANCADQEGISVSCLGFKNLPEIKKLFSKIKQAFYLDMYQNKLVFYDQPFFNMFLISNQMVNKTDYKNLVLSRPTPEEAAEKRLVAVHFAGCPGHAQIKLDLFVDFKSRYIWPSPAHVISPAHVESPVAVEDPVESHVEDASLDPVAVADTSLDPVAVADTSLDPVEDTSPVESPDPITLNIVEDTLNEQNLIEFIRTTNPNYTFDEQTKRRNLFASSVSSNSVCFIGGDTAVPAAIIINNNPTVKVAIVESLVASPASQRVNPRIEITSAETILAEKRKYDTIVIDEREQLEKAILVAMRLSNPGTTIVMNGIEHPAVAAVWTKYVQMLDMEPTTDIKFKDSATQSVRIIR